MGGEQQRLDQLVMFIHVREKQFVEIMPAIDAANYTPGKELGVGAVAVESRKPFCRHLKGLPQFGLNKK